MRRENPDKCLGQSSPFSVLESRAQVLFASSSGTKTPPGHPERFPRALSAYAKKTHFNGTILVQQKGKTIYNRSFGMANVQFAVPNSNATKYRIASITKLFTSVLIMQLQEEKKLDLNQPIRTYLPSYKGEGAEKVTIFNLLTATSGIESNEKDVHNDDVPAMYARAYTTDELLHLFCSGKLEHEPGKVWNYNNGDYVILGKIIEAIYKKPYEAVLREKILDPLQMEHTGMSSMIQVVPDLADVYWINETTRAIENNPPIYFENYYAAGGLYSSAEDLLKFSNALYGNRLVQAASLKSIMEPFLSRYGLGIWVYDKQIGSKTIRIQERQGAIWRIRTRLVHIPGENITVILLSNIQTANIDDVQNEIIKSLVN
jgi:CubicO group peptidase (beta-lactamase class C family)